MQQNSHAFGARWKQMAFFGKVTKIRSRTAERTTPSRLLPKFAESVTGRPNHFISVAEWNPFTLLMATVRSYHGTTKSMVFVAPNWTKTPLAATLKMCMVLDECSKSVSIAGVWPLSEKFREGRGRDWTFTITISTFTFVLRSRNLD